MLLLVREIPERFDAHRRALLRAGTLGASLFWFSFSKETEAAADKLLATFDPLAAMVG